MTKGQAARALADAIVELIDDDVQLRNLLSEAELPWSSFDGTARERVYKAICRASSSALHQIVNTTAARYKHQGDNLRCLLARFTAIPGTLWVENVSKEFNPKCPYPGMRAFQSPTCFYGREELTSTIVQRIAASPLCMVIGASGSGKSSVLAAGVIPQWLRQQEEGSTLLIRPDWNPFEGVYASLVQMWDQQRASKFRRPAHDLLVSFAQEAAIDSDKTFLIILDQFERTLATETVDIQASKNEFMTALVHFAEAAPANLRVVIGMRDDFLGVIGQYPDLCRFTDDKPVRVSPLDTDGLREAILRPAQEHGVQMDSDIVDAIVEKVGGRNGMLPLMQDLLRQLWFGESNLAADRRLNLATYNTLGGVLGALAKKMDDLCQAKGEEQIRRIFLQTVQILADPKSPAISRQGRLADISAEDRNVVKELIDRDKVLVSRDSDKEHKHLGVFELPHEALIEKWPRFNKWIAESREALYLAHRLSDDVTEWHAHRAVPGAATDEIDDAYCWRGRRLEDVIRLSSGEFPRLGIIVSHEMQSFLDESAKREQFARDRQLAEANEAARYAENRRQEVEKQVIRESQLRRRSQWWARAAMIGCLVAVAAAALALIFKLEVHKQLIKSEYLLDLAKLREAGNALENNNLELAENLLESAKVPLEKNYFAWYELHHEMDGALFTIYGHTGGVRSVVFSPDGQQLVTASGDGTARLWDARTGQSLHELTGHRDVTTAAFSADGEKIVTGSNDGTVRVWDANTRQSLRELNGHKGVVTSVAFSPDGQQVVTASADRIARIWDAQSGRVLCELTGHTNPVDSVAFSPDGQLIVTGSMDTTARVWDARKGTLLHVLDGQSGQVTSVAFSPNGNQILIGSGDGTARIWHARTWQSMRELKGHTGIVSSVSFSPDGQQIVTGSIDRTARVWDARTGQSLRELKGHVEPVGSVAFSSNGQQIVTGSWDGTVRVWDARAARSLPELKGHKSGITCIAFSPDGHQIVTGSLDGAARGWDAYTGQALYELKFHTRAVKSVAFSPDGDELVTGSEDKTACVWDTRKREPLLELRGTSWGVESVAFSPDGQQIVTGDLDKIARVWDARTGHPLRQLKGHSGAVRSVAFSSDGQQIVTGSDDGSARVWDANTGQSLRELIGFTGSVGSVAFSKDGQQIVTGSDNGSARVWDTQTGQSLRELKGHTGSVMGVAFSPEGHELVTGAWDNTARVWSVETGQLIHELKGHTRAVSCVAFSRDGRRIVTGSHDKTARVWGAREGQSFRQLNGHTLSVICMTYSPNGQQIVAGALDTTACVWDVRTGQTLSVLKGHSGPIHSLVYSPDGQKIVTGSWDTTARVWDSNTGQSLRELKGHTAPIDSVAFSPDGKQIVTGSRDRSARVWDAQTGQLLHSTNHVERLANDFELPGQQSVVFSPDGQQISMASRGGTTVWDLRSGQLTADKNGKASPMLIERASLSPDGKWFAYRRFNKVLLIPTTLDAKTADKHRKRTCPRPDLHQFEAEELKQRASNDPNVQFAYQVQLALVQQALGQEKIDNGKPEEASPFFAKAKELRPKHMLEADN